MSQAGSKRPAQPMAVTSVDDVAHWLAEQIDSGGCGKVTAETRATVLESVRENEVDREVLATLSESDLMHTLGVVVLGQRRKMMQRIKDLLGLAPSLPAQAQLGIGAQTPTNLATHVPAASPDTSAATGAAAQACLSFSMTPHATLKDAATAPPAADATAPAGHDPAAVGIASEISAFPFSPQPAKEVWGGIEAGAAAAASDDLAEHEAAAAETARLRTASMELTADVKEKMLAEDFCVNEGQWATKKLLKVLAQSVGWAIPAQRQALMIELEALADKIRMPGCSVVTVGDTGAGKSTLLNALLGETCVLPTNGMRACTASIIELTFNSNEDGDPYVGTVEFVTREEWEAEFEQLLDDLTQQDGKAILREPDQRAPSYASWCKLFAIYGTTYTHSSIKVGGVYTNPTIEQLKRKLRDCTRVTRVCGTAQTVTAKSAGEFRRKLERYMDSENEVFEGQFWPLVKRVRMTSRNWSLLKTGGKLVDAPGVRDDNNARDKVVKEYLREADSIWIVASINRAVNDKTAKNMLGESFRRELLMDGQYNNICFVATQSDVLNRSEISRSLALAPEASLAHCAAQRNSFTRDRIMKDFHAGLNEMASHAQGTVSAQELCERYRLPVFCVSAVDFQKLSGSRLSDGAPNVWEDIEDTEIPSLQRFFHENVLQKRFSRAHASMTALVNFCDMLESFLAPDTDETIGSADAAAVRQLAREAYSAEERRLNEAIAMHTANLDSKVERHFSGTIGPQLQAGAQQASHHAMDTARKWSSGQTKMHWATYKAHVRRLGTFRIDMNQELAEHIFRAVSTVWDNVFSATAQKDLQEAQDKLKDAFKASRAAFIAQLRAATLPGMARTVSRAGVLEGPQERGIDAKLAEATVAAKRFMTDRQRELSRTVVPLIQTTMTPGYQAGAAESGTGSGARRVAVVERHLDRSKSSMFTQSVQTTIAELPQMKSAVVSRLREVAQDAARAQRVGFSSLWEAEAASQQMAEAQKRLLAQLKEHGFMATARIALRKLRVAHKLEQAGVTNDDEITDVTDALRPPQFSEILDLTSESDGPNGKRSADESMAESLSCVVSVRVGQSDAFRVRIYMHDALGKVFSAFCSRRLGNSLGEAGTQPEKVKFIFDGQRVDHTSTPQTLDMEPADDNLVEAVLPAASV